MKKVKTVEEFRREFAEIARRKIGELHRRPDLHEDFRQAASEKLNAWYLRLVQAF